jgi:hypothetical protein
MSSGTWGQVPHPTIHTYAKNGQLEMLDATKHKKIPRGTRRQLPRPQNTVALILKN